GLGLDGFRVVALGRACVLLLRRLALGIAHGWPMVASRCCSNSAAAFGGATGQRSPPKLAKNASKAARKRSPSTKYPSLCEERSSHSDFTGGRAARARRSLIANGTTSSR